MITIQVNNPDIFLVRGDIRWSACSLHGSQFRRFYTTLDDADVCRAEIDDGRQIFLCEMFPLPGDLNSAADCTQIHENTSFQN